jgi:hypothetical protein
MAKSRGTENNENELHQTRKENERLRAENRRQKNRVCPAPDRQDIKEADAAPMQQGIRPGIWSQKAL